MRRIPISVRPDDVVKGFVVNAKEIEDKSLQDYIMQQRTFLEKLFRQTPKDLVLLLDESQKLSGKNLDALQSLWDENIIKSAVLSHTSSDLKQFSKSIEERIGSRVIRLKTLTKKEAQNLINLRTKNNHPFALFRLLELSYRGRATSETKGLRCHLQWGP